MTKLEELKEMLREWERTSSVTKAYDICIYLATNLDRGWKDAQDRDVLSKPLIKDESIRKAIRAWAEANEIDCEDTLTAHLTDSALWALSHEEAYGCYISMEFLGDADDGILSKKQYTVKELCGEEDE